MKKLTCVLMGLGLCMVSIQSTSAMSAATAGKAKAAADKIIAALTAAVTPLLKSNAGLAAAQKVFCTQANAASGKFSLRSFEGMAANIKDAVAIGYALCGGIPNDALGFEASGFMKTGLQTFAVTDKAGLEAALIAWIAENKGTQTGKLTTAIVKARKPGSLGEGLLASVKPAVVSLDDLG